MERSWCLRQFEVAFNLILATPEETLITNCTAHGPL